MRPETFKNEAEHCRRQAETAFIGRPESRLLLQLAGAFEELASAPARASRSPSP